MIKKRKRYEESATREALQKQKALLHKNAVSFHFNI